jgi:hypothetical protein
LSAGAAGAEVFHHGPANRLAFRSVDISVFVRVERIEQFLFYRRIARRRTAVARFRGRLGRSRQR